ncbi:MAG: proton-conducting transporter membrane subunit, partial [Alphaproteobacteria bacterium]
MSSLAYIPPGLYIILGALLIPFFRGNIRNAYMLVLPILGLFGLMQAQEGTYWQFLLFGQTLSPVRVDGLSLVFGYIFHIAAIVSIIFAFHIKDTVQQVAGLVYAGSAIGAAFAGDLITLFVYWEGTAISSVFLIWAGKSEASFKSGMRYLIIQIFSGVLLLAGSVMHFKATGSLTFDKMSLSGLVPTLIFAAFGIKAAFPLLHNWLQDAYPNATVTGTVFLSAFTTKLAIYGLARGFPGTEMLIWIGAVMAIFPIFYAMIENDLRRVLAYGLNNQLGFMVVGVGIGTELALNGTAAHAFAHILYKG